MLELITLDNKEKHKIIEGTVIKPLKVNSDETGILVETLRKDWQDIYNAEDRGFAMQYYSVTHPFIARDEKLWHLHPGGQEDRFLVVSGDVVVAIADTRKDSNTEGVLNLFHMQSQKNPYLLLVPKRTLHGFMVVSDNPGILLNFPTRLYDPKEELRVPHDEAMVSLPNGVFFTWELVRNHFRSSLIK